jgi:hypothetical protein
VKKIGIVIVGLLLLTGCEGATKADAPEPVTGSIVDGTNTHVIRMPNGYRNVVVTCYGSNGVYVTSRGAWQNGNKDATTLPSSIAVIANDPMCH